MLKPSILTGAALVSATLFGVSIQNVHVTIHIPSFRRSRELMGRLARRVYRHARLRLRPLPR